MVVWVWMHPCAQVKYMSLCWLRISNCNNTMIAIIIAIITQLINYNSATVCTVVINSFVIKLGLRFCRWIQKLKWIIAGFTRINMNHSISIVTSYSNPHVHYLGLVFHWPFVIRENLFIQLILLLNCKCKIYMSNSGRTLVKKDNLTGGSDYIYSTYMGALPVPGYKVSVSVRHRLPHEPFVPYTFDSYRNPFSDILTFRWG